MTRHEYIRCCEEIAEENSLRIDLKFEECEMYVKTELLKIDDDASIIYREDEIINNTFSAWFYGKQTKFTFSDCGIEDIEILQYPEYYYVPSYCHSEELLG